MPVIQPPEAPKGCATTSVKGEVTIGTVAPHNQGYLMEKARYAARFPRLTVKPLKGGGVTDVELKQLVMSGLIKADEYRHDFRWDYKAEVSFDMSPKRPSPPIPFLSTSLFRDQKPDPDRRHTMTFFPSGRTSGLLRRPDVIIVQNPKKRWPGTEGRDHDGAKHEDNLERVVEVKFPNDFLSQDQRQDYERIAGKKSRFAVLEVSDCRDDEDRKRDKEYNREHRPTRATDPAKWLPLLPPKNPGRPPRPAPVPVPAYGPEPAARAAHIESWTQQVQSAVDSLLEQGAQGIRQLSEEMQKHLHEAVTWLDSKGEWVRNEAQKTWQWLSEKGGKVLSWTDDQLRAIWMEVQRYTDLTLEMLKEINWAQVLVDLGIAVATVVVVVAIGAGLVSLGIPAALVSGFLLLIRLAIAAWGALAGVLSAGAAAAGTAVAGATASVTGAVAGTAAALTGLVVVPATAAAH
ncbi:MULTISPECIES: VRR-NUC domain-containing protein [unclassified Pseudomonas]|uniref:VRR-NUC domain-containing protein n=1 Tax=unclassified Pseudomonas TaxID=196821 RepID=UPI001B31A34D|nr:MULTISPECIES: VRR-NUC domain-containing protein [unclassified Pseudomonas]MBP5942952.1 VRR-NUC domain-containing protein [Pseudomonas sp. P9(2020)]MBZ9561868.1 VRR-NUC domain-containing protein [Pseudomonas sp. P116]